MPPLPRGGGGGIFCVTGGTIVAVECRCCPRTCLGFFRYVVKNVKTSPIFSINIFHSVFYWRYFFFDPFAIRIELVHVLSIEFASASVQKHFFDDENAGRIFLV